MIYLFNMENKKFMKRFAEVEIKNSFKYNRIDM